MIALLASLAASGCVVRQGDFSVLSNKLVRTSDFDLDDPDRARQVEGRDVQHIILFIPTSGQPSLEGALDDAFSRGGGDVMTDAVVHSWGWYIPYVYGQFGWTVEGDVVRTRR